MARYKSHTEKFNEALSKLNATLDAQQETMRRNKASHASPYAQAADGSEQAQESVYAQEEGDDDNGSDERGECDRNAGHDVLYHEQVTDIPMPPGMEPDVHEQIHGPLHRTTEADDFDAQRLHKEMHPPLFFGSISQLDAPPPRPGYEQRWIRVSGVDPGRDAANIRRKMTRHGWRPRLAETIPADYPLTENARMGSYGNVFKVADVVLMERTLAMAQQHRAYLKHQAARLIQTIQPFVKDGTNAILAQANLGPRFGAAGAVVERMQSQTSNYLEDALNG